MAKEEEENDIPAYIDYDGSDELEIERWNANNFETFWGNCLSKKRRMAAHPWSIKHKSLAKRMIHEFELEDLKEMINYWTESSKTDAAPIFELFYTNRHTVYDKIRDKDYSDWEM